MKIINEKMGFTLAETMIVLVVLGIIASLTIPVLIKRYVENSNKAKIKKAMTAYETAINKMVIENNLKSDNDIDVWATINGEDENCSRTREYFKSAQDGPDSCTFKTSDGLWWNIKPITHPLISIIEIKNKNNTEQSLEKIQQYATDSENKKAFYLTSWIDTNGILRVNDFNASMKNIPSTSTKIELEKIYNYIGIPVEAKYSAAEMLDAFIKGNFDKPCENPDKRLACTHCKSCYIMANNEIAYYDENGVFLFLERKYRNDVAINVKSYSSAYGSGLSDYHYYLYKHTGNYDENFPSTFELGEGWCYNCERDWITKSYNSFNRSSRPTYNYSNAISGLANW